MPGVLKVTLPGVADALVAGEPPGKIHRYAPTEPLASVPEPEKVTDWPAEIVTSPAGRLMAPRGGWLVGFEDTCTNGATEGTPLASTMNSM